MKLLHICKTASLLLCSTIILFASEGVQAAPFADTPTVSRGDFIRSALQELVSSVRTQDDYDLPYVRVPKSMLPYIQAAHDDEALSVFGTDLRLGFPITRGEALRFIVELEDVSSQKTVSFRDVRKGTMIERAVKVAIDKSWMGPLRDNYFGVDRKLTGKQAQKLLNAVQGKVKAPTNDDADGRKITVPVTRFRPTGAMKSGVVPNSKLMEAVWHIINRDYLYQEKIDNTESSYQAIESLVKSLDDPYSRFLRPQKAKNFQTQINGEISGIGAQVEDRDGILTIVTPLSGSPAEKAGVKPNDKVIKVDGVDIKGMNFIDAVEKIRGKRGTSVELTINRSGIILKIDVVRDIVQVPEIAISWQGNVAIVRLMQFGKLTEANLRKHMEDIQNQNPTGLIIDLRNNPGGLLTAANLVLSTVLPEDSEVAIIKTKDSEHVNTTSQAPVIKANVPMVVLINEGSASASEIVAGALQDYGRARLVGQKSFGKGTVQEVLEFIDHSSLKLTIAEWLTPKGRKINGVGVTPDIEVEFSSDRDTQLIKALELLR